MFGSRVETEVVGFFVFSYIKIVLRFRNGGEGGSYFINTLKLYFGFYSRILLAL